MIVLNALQLALPLLAATRGSALAVGMATAASNPVLEQARIAQTTSFVTAGVSFLGLVLVAILSRRVRSHADVRGEGELELSRVSADAESAREGQKVALQLVNETRENSKQILSELRAQAGVAQVTIDRLNDTIGRLTDALRVAQEGGVQQSELIATLQLQLRASEVDKARQEVNVQELRETIRERELALLEAQAELVEATAERRATA